MALTTVDVRVLNCGTVVATLADRPVRILPTGYAGAVFRGLVYPLYAGDFIDLDDEPFSKDSCSGFVTRGCPIPYSPTAHATDDADHLGIESWYLESNRFGHYLVFDSSQIAAERLVDTLTAAGLGVLRWDESSRAADNGEMYDWFIRLDYQGSRDQCLRRVSEILEDFESVPRDKDASESTVHTESADTNYRQIADMLIAASDAPLDSAAVINWLQAFGQSSIRGGYLSWRFREFTTRPGYSDSSGPEAVLYAMSSIVNDDRRLVTRLTTEHGPFLAEDRPHVVQRAMDDEFDKIDPDDSWRTPDEALRRARSSLAFLRSATILAFGSNDGHERLLAFTSKIAPPQTSAFNGSPQHVVAAVTNLRRMAELIEELFAGAGDDLAELHERGRSELLALQQGQLDFIASAITEPPRDQRQPRTNDLPFAILPPGERIHDFLGDLRATGVYRGGIVDPGRLTVLERLWDALDGNGCMLYRGVFPSSNSKDNGYVVLGIQFADKDHEDAIAISPWKDEHATFVVRSDCGYQKPWETVLSRTKYEAKQMGARRLMFRANPEHGMDAYEAMYEKILAHLLCSPTEFDNGTIYYDEYEGHYRVRESDERLTPQRQPDSGEPTSRSTSNVVERALGWLKFW